MRVAFWCTPGSSPHARGTQCSIVRTRQNPRFIPACAGNATFQDLADVYMSVHPRMRGERLARPTPHQQYPGSSPHARGTHRERPSLAAHRRFIPACAGNAGIVNGPSLACVGSSPHARGTPSPDAYRSWQTRFIPACAGNAIFVMTKFLFLSVHPRMRGERFRWLMIPCKCSGSSPHARGTQFHQSSDGSHIRFIPACAGNAEQLAHVPGRRPVHPRMRGERLASAPRASRSSGSSPHARGTPSTCYGKDGFPRFIPACAGNASGAFDDVQILAVHPRMRGERCGHVTLLECEFGSSPHARGTHGANGVCGSGGRFIPACAGNALAST